MTKRKQVDASTQAKVLVASGRRCCLCYGLFGDFNVKRGQIAHVDGDASNGRMENLVFLCLEHHDGLDSRSNQSKGLTPEEVTFYREVLHRDVKSNLPRPVDDASTRLRGLINSLRPPGEQMTGLLTDLELRKAIESGLLRITPYDVACLGPASYRLRVGDQVLAYRGGVREIVEGRSFVLNPGESAVVTSLESLSLPPGVLGRLIPVARMQRLLVAVATGTHIDPGFTGRLTLGIENRSARSCELAVGAPMAAVEFWLLASIESDRRQWGA